MWNKYNILRPIFKNNTVLLLGENHFFKNDLIDIEKIVKDFKPDLLAHELLYEDKVCSNDIKNRLYFENKFINNNLNRDIYELGQFIGCDLVGIDKECLSYSILKREQHMYNMIIKIIQNCNKRCVVVVGDTHLRRSVSNLGLKSILSELNFNKRIFTIRSGKMEIY